MTLDPDGDGLWCQFCGTRRTDPDAQQAAAVYRASGAGHEDYEPPSRNWEMDFSQRLLLDNAWDSLHEGDQKTAQYMLLGAVRQWPNFADAWYLLSLTTGDRAEQLMYLDKALEAQPYHEYAWRDKGVLEGVIPGGEGKAVAQPAPAGPVEAESETQECPSCGGALAFDAALGALTCHHCGYRPGGIRLPAYRSGYDKLDNALLQRRFGFSREWHIGERVLVCQNCAAQLTLSGIVLSTQCPFCDSAHVLVQDAVGSFEEPDALLPFKLDRRAAAQVVHNRLAPELRPQVERGDLLGVYLPFWAFEGLVSIIMPLTATVLGALRPGVYPVHDVLVSGVAQPREAILAELMPYDLHELVRYDHRYLAQWPAQLYSLDVIQASITGRAYIKYAARQQATGYHVAEGELARSSGHYAPPDSALWQVAQVEAQGLNYRLLLLPVWSITLVMGAGQRLPAVVNGQTGECVISASFVQPETMIARPNRSRIQPLPHHNVIRPIPPPRR
jgi:hypothetical protein